MRRVHANARSIYERMKRDDDGDSDRDHVLEIALCPDWATRATPRRRDQEQRRWAGSRHTFCRSWTKTVTTSFLFHSQAKEYSAAHGRSISILRYRCVHYYIHDLEVALI